MAPKRASHLEIPPAASSSEEEEETSSEEEEETSEDEDVQATPKPSVSSLQPKNTDQSQSQSESESDDESSSESEPADSTVKPIASKPMEETNARSKPPSVVATPEGKATSKRPRDSEDSKKQAKKKKSGSEAPVDDGSGAASDEEEEEEEPKKPAGGGGDESKKLFQRLWSEEDEIVILNGITGYGAKKGADPAATDMNAFHDFIKKSLHIEVTKAQLSDKVRRLKKKYSNNAARKKYNPTKPHEQKVFELSKKIWGGGGGGGGGAGVSLPKSNSAAAAKSNGKAVLASLAVSKEGSKKNEIDGKAMDLASSSKMIGFDMKSLSLSDHVLKKGLDLIPESKKAELEAKWRKLHIDEMELFLKKNQLISEQVKLVIEKLKSSDH